jgi:hypothetical protein
MTSNTKDIAMIMLKYDKSKHGAMKHMLFILQIRSKYSMFNTFAQYVCNAVNA